MTDSTSKKDDSGVKGFSFYALRGAIGIAALAAGIALFSAGTGIFVLAQTAAATVLATTVNTFIDLAVATGLLPLLLPLAAGAALIVGGAVLTVKTAFSFFKEGFSGKTEGKKPEAAFLSGAASVSFGKKITSIFNDARRAGKQSPAIGGAAILPRPPASA